jgi:glyoxylase-like metal-dependent hydrolase (beta-lactamase superfamily II)
MITTRRRRSRKVLSWTCQACLLVCVGVSLGASDGRPVTQQAPPKALHLYVHVAPEDSFGVTSTLILGRTEAILIDTQYHVSEAMKLADEIAASGTRLKAVFITHPDIDHYMGSAAIHQRFPTTPIYMTAAALAHYDATAARKLAGAKKYAPAQTPDALPQPQALPQNRLTVDGAVVEIVPDVQGDVLEQSNSFVWIPSLKAVIAGDIVFDGTHTYLADSTKESRQEWRRSVDRIASLKPVVVVAGHKKTPGNPESAAALTFTRTYLDAFDAARRSASTPDELTAAMKKRFPEAVYEYLLLASARQAFAPDPAPQVGFQQGDRARSSGQDVGSW